MLTQGEWVPLTGGRRLTLTSSLAVITIAIFGLDLTSPLEASVPLLYLAVIWMSTDYRDYHRTIAVAAICSLLIVVAYFVSLDGVHTWRSLVDHALSLASLGIVTFLCTQLIRAQERFRLIVEAAPTGMLAVNQDGHIILANPHVEQLFGYRSRELLGQPIETLLPDRLREAHVDERDRFLREPKSRPMGKGRDLYGRRKNGDEFPIEIGLNPVSTPQGQCVLASVVDITERKSSERLLARHANDLAALNLELRRSNADLDAFAHLASHDLQEPIRTLNSYVALLQEDLGHQIAPEAATDLHFIWETSKRMQNLVQDLLSFSRAGRKSMKREHVELDVCLAEALQSLSALVNETRAVVHSDRLPAVMGDSTLLAQIFQNLLGNALKFTRPEEAPVVEILAREQSGEYQIRIQDNGIGIDPQYAEQIFEPFKRLHTRSTYPGSGIGLSLCRRAIERHGGRIWVESKPGQGSCFIFTLPIPTEQVDQNESVQTGGVVSRG